MQELLDSELLKMLRAIMPVLLVVLLALAGIEGYFIKQNADNVNSLQIQNQILQAAQAQSSAQFRIYVRALTGEDNYMCLVLHYINAHDASMPAAPPLSICHVVSP